jgi:hypothetical protein
MKKMNAYFQNFNFTNNETKEKSIQFASTSSLSFSSSPSQSDYNYRTYKKVIQNNDLNASITNPIYSDSEPMDNIDNYRLKANKSESRVLKTKNINLDFDVRKYKKEKYKNIKIPSSTVIRTSSAHSKSNQEYQVIPKLNQIEIPTLPTLQSESSESSKNVFYEPSTSLQHFLLRGFKKDINSNKLDDFECYNSKIFGEKYGLEKIPKLNRDLNKTDSELIAYWYKTENGNIYSGVVDVLK